MILIQDPILQKRSYVTALDMFNDRQKIINYAPIIPKLNSDGTIEMIRHIYGKEQGFTN